LIKSGHFLKKEKIFLKPYIIICIVWIPLFQLPSINSTINWKYFQIWGKVLPFYNYVSFYRKLYIELYLIPSHTDCFYCSHQLCLVQQEPGDISRVHCSCTNSTVGLAYQPRETCSCRYEQHSPSSVCFAEVITKAKKK